MAVIESRVRATPVGARRWSVVRPNVTTSRLAIGIGFALVSAACGSSAKTTGTTTTGSPTTSSAGTALTTATSTNAAPNTVSKADYITRANAICAQSDAKTKAVAQPNQTDMRAVATWTDQLLTIGKKEIADLRSLKPPPGDKATLDGLYALGDAAMVQMQRARDSARKGDTSAVSSALSAVVSASGEFNQIATSYGLTVCGSTS